MPLVSRAQVGVKNESTYGTAVVVDKFAEFYQDTVKPDHRRISSKNMRAGTRVARTDRFAVWRAGAGGDFGFEVLSKGFAFWLVHMLGTVATTGPAETVVYTHTGTIGDLKGDSFTYQTNRPFFPADTDQPFTFSGGKVSSWEMGCKVGEPLMFRGSLDFQDYLTATGLASASYPSGTVEMFTFLGATVSIGGSQYDFSESFTVGCDNKLQTGDYRLRASGLKQEPHESDFRAVTWALDADFDSLTQFNRFASATAAGAVATVVATFAAPTLIGSTLYPTITVTIDGARFDEFDNSVDGPTPLKQKLSGTGLFDGTDSALTVAVKSVETTP